jgi:D-arabinose 1-dehydrogenase-like Zn-dependent alcohol dehydrogenase
MPAVYVASLPNRNLSSLWCSPLVRICPKLLSYEKLTRAAACLGSARYSEDRLNSCALTGTPLMIETFPREQAATAYDRMLSAKTRFRLVLTMN